MTDDQTSICAGCERQIPKEYNVCPYCGRPQNQIYGPPQSQPFVYEPIGGLRYILYILSFFILIIGFVIFMVWINNRDPEKRQIGKNCLIISFAAIVLVIIIFPILFLLTGL